MIARSVTTTAGKMDALQDAVQDARTTVTGELDALQTTVNQALDQVEAMMTPATTPATVSDRYFGLLMS